MSSQAERGNPAAAFIQGEQGKTARDPRPSVLRLRGGFSPGGPIPSLESDVDIGPPSAAAPHRLISSVFASDSLVVQFPVRLSSSVPDAGATPPPNHTQDGDTNNKALFPGVHSTKARVTAAAGALTFLLAACSSHGGIKIPEPLRSVAHQVGKDAQQAEHDTQRDAGRLRQGAQRAAHSQDPEIEQQLRQARDKAVRNGKETIKKGRQIVDEIPSPTPRPTHP